MLKGLRSSSYKKRTLVAFLITEKNAFSLNLSQMLMLTVPKVLPTKKETKKNVNNILKPTNLLKKMISSNLPSTAHAARLY